MVGQDLSRRAVELDLLVDTDINLGEVVLVEVRLQHLTLVEDVLLLEFLLRAEDEPGSVDLLVLGRDGLSLLGVLLSQGSDVLIEASHLLVELGDVDVLLVEFLAQGLQLLVFLLHLLGQVVDDLLQLVTLDAALTHLLLQLVDELLVLLHGRLDELHVLLDAKLGVGTFTFLGNCHAVLCLCDLTEALLDVTQGGHHVVDLIVFLGNDLFQRVALHKGSLLCFLHSVVATCNHQASKGQNNQFSHKFEF